MASKQKSSTPSDKPTKGRPRKSVPRQAARAEQGEGPAGETPTLPTSEPAPPGTAIPSPAAKAPVAQSSPVEPSQRPERTALDAAVHVLRETGQAISCPEWIARMVAQGCWISPKGKTPSSTLYSARLREIQTKGEQARFVRSERGQFALREAV
jgi:hypothetical protein